MTGSSRKHAILPLGLCAAVLGLTAIGMAGVPASRPVPEPLGSASGGV